MSFIDSNILAQNSGVTGFTRVDKSAEDGVAATASKLATVSLVKSMNSSFTMPSTPCTAP